MRESDLGVRTLGYARIALQPKGQLLLVQLPGREIEKDQHGCGLFRSNFPAIQLEKRKGRNQRNALVPIDERMIAGEAKSIGCGEIEHAGLLITREVLGSSGGGFQQRSIAEPSRAAELRYQFAMHRYQIISLEPDPSIHFASSRRAFR